MKAEIECVVPLAKAGLNFRQIEELIAASRALKRADEAACNGLPTGNRVERALKRAEKALNLAACTESAGFGLRHQSDPRGCSLYLALPDGRELPVWG